MRDLANHSPLSAEPPSADSRAVSAPEVPTLDVGFVDTSAADLSFSLGHGRIAPLATTIVALPTAVGPTAADPLDAGPTAARVPLTLELSVIGSSHQVILTDTGGTPVLIETFACLGEGESSPAHGPDWNRPRTTTGDWAGFSRHEFRCTRSVASTGFQDSVAEVVARARACAHHVVVEFPGAPGAITALALTGAAPDHLRWQTWHCYPPTAEIVHSETVLSQTTDQNRRAPMVDAHE